MSETSTLISYSGKISRTELDQVPTPPATPTHIPIPHIEVVETLVETLNLRHIGVVAEEFAVSSGSAKKPLVGLPRLCATLFLPSQGSGFVRCPSRITTSVGVLLNCPTGETAQAEATGRARPACAPC